MLEGVSGPRGGLTALLKKVGRAGPNGQAYRALENPEVRFSRRLYTSFDADLKKVRVMMNRDFFCERGQRTYTLEFVLSSAVGLDRGNVGVNTQPMLPRRHYLRCTSCVSTAQSGNKLLIFYAVCA